MNQKLKQVLKFFSIFFVLVFISFVLGFFTKGFGDCSAGFPLDFESGGCVVWSPRVFHPINFIIDVLFFSVLTIGIVKYLDHRKNKKNS